MPRVAVLALAIAVLAAGCLGQDPEPAVSNNAAPPAVPTFSFSPAIGVDDTRAAAEPSIRVAPDGVIWITAPEGLGGGDLVWRSTDGGATFEYMATPDPVFGGGDSDLAIATDGRLWQSGLWLGCVSVATSTDGSSWAMNPVACREPIDDRQWLDTHGAETAYVTFGGGVSGGGPAIQVLKSVLAEPVPVMVTTSILPDSSDYQWPGNLAVDETTGNVYVAYLTVDDKAFVFKSADGGDSWEKIPVSERAGDTFDSFVVVAVDRAGNVYETWSEREGDGRTSIYLTVSQDQGVTWREPIRVNSDTIATTVFPWIVAGDAGRIDVVYYGTEATGDSPETVDGLWHVYLAQSLDMLAEAPTFTETRMSESPVKDGSICTSGTGCAPGTRGLLDYFQVDVDLAGYANVAYTENLEDPGIVMFVKQTSGPSLFLNATAPPEEDGAGAGSAAPRGPLRAIGAALARLE